MSAVQTVDQIIQIAVGDIAFQAIKTAIEAEMPWLKAPIVNQIWSMCYNYFCGLMIEQLKHEGASIVFSIQTAAEESDYGAALAAYKKALASGDQNEIAKTLAAFKAAAAPLVHFDT